MNKFLGSKGWRALAFFLCLVFGLLTVGCAACGVYDYFEFGMDPSDAANFTESEIFYTYVNERALSTRLERGFENLYLFLFNGRMVFLPLAGLGLLLTLSLFAFLLASAGRTPEGAELRGVHRWPLELYTALLMCLFGLGSILFFEMWDEIGYIAYLGIAIPVLAAAILVMGTAALLWCMDMAVRIRAGKWWRNTLTFFVLRFCWRLCRRLFAVLKAAVTALPAGWKLGAAFCVAAAANVFLTLLADFEFPFCLFLLLVFDAACLTGLLLLSAQWKKLMEAGRALADGDLNHHLDTDSLWLDLQAHGEDLNAVSRGMARAVEERMRSERFKTELITNVSHDLKTPLTNIVSYVDLLKKEEIDDPRAAEYIEVLDRQAAKLKKLTEDLVDAAKATSGALPVNWEELDLRELLRQAEGEYAGRLSQAGIEGVYTLPEEPCLVRADGRLLWRVLDNLFSNVTRYAQSGTRFYVNLEHGEQGAELTLRNISRQKLNIPAEELMERFVRGDRARSGEGSGLGLSIARSLTENMGGSLGLWLDGDLFKVTIRLPSP